MVGPMVKKCKMENSTDFLQLGGSARKQPSQSPPVFRHQWPATRPACASFSDVRQNATRETSAYRWRSRQLFDAVVYQAIPSVRYGFSKSIFSFRRSKSESRQSNASPRAMAVAAMAASKNPICWPAFRSSEIRRANWAASF